MFPFAKSTCRKAGVSARLSYKAGKGNLSIEEKAKTFYYFNG